MAQETVTLQLEMMGHGGKAIGHYQGRPILVAGGLPGERVAVLLAEQKGGAQMGQLQQVITPSPYRIVPRCTHSGGDCDYQHATYPYQLKLKEGVVRDQFTRIGRLNNPRIAPILAHPQPWSYALATTLYPTPEKQGLGYWSRTERIIAPFTQCHLLHPILQELSQQFDLDLPTLRQITLRVGSDEHPMIVLEVEEAEPPELEINFPVSIALVLPDGVAGTLIGDPYLWHEIDDRVWRVSAGSEFAHSWAGASLLRQAVRELTQLQGTETVIDCFSGVGLLTQQLAIHAKKVIGIDKSEVAVDDLAENLADYGNVEVYQDWAEDVLPMLPNGVELLLIDDEAQAISAELIRKVIENRPKQLLLSLSELNLATKLAQQLQKEYQLELIQPLDLQPQTHHIHTVTQWRRRG